MWDTIIRFWWCNGGLLIAASLVLLPAPVRAQERRSGARVWREVHRDVSPPLDTIKPLPPPDGPPDEGPLLPAPPFAPAQLDTVALPDGVLQIAVAPLVGTVPGLNLDLSGSTPPISICVNLRYSADAPPIKTAAGPKS